MGSVADFQKLCEILADFFWLEHIDFPSILKTLFCQKFLHRTQLKRKKQIKVPFYTLFEKFRPKVAFLRRALPFKMSIFWRPKETFFLLNQLNNLLKSIALLANRFKVTTFTKICPRAVENERLDDLLLNTEQPLFLGKNEARVYVMKLY